MANLGSYTTTEAVRGCLGVDSDDIPDAYMVDSKLNVELTVDLDSWLATHAALYSAGTTGTPSAEAASIAAKISLYAQWFCALEMANRPMTLPQNNSDGKAQFTRFKVDFEKVAALAAAKVAKYRAELAEDTGSGGTATPVINLLSVGVPSVDPITEGLQ
jgi:hypothetical protein